MSTTRPLAAVAVLVSPQDSVAVVKATLTSGDVVELDGGEAITITGQVAPGHRFATRPIPAGELVLQYGSPIGTSLGIGVGDPVTPGNMSNEVPVVREVPDDLSNPAPEYVIDAERGTFQGFARPDGRVGSRNWILIVPTSMCSSHEAQQIAMIAELMKLDRERYPNVDGVVSLPHNKGCGTNDSTNLEVLFRTLANYADHPNVGGVIFIDLGCEKTNLSALGRWLKTEGGLSWDKPVHWMGVQESGGTKKAIEKGLEVVEGMFEPVNRAQRTEVGLDKLVLGVKCGASDGFSGLSANPALGRAADLVVEHGGTVIITEVPEFCGAEHLFAARARDAQVARDVFEAVDWYKALAARFDSQLGQNPSPGNAAGGLLNITIKSLGAMAKSGTTRVEGVTPYASPPDGRGLWLMQGPGYDQESTPGLVGAGCQVVVFTTGRGTTIGNAIAPVLKLTSNNAVFERMPGDLDLSAGGVIDGTETIDEVGQRVFEYVCEVAGGKPALAEENGHREFQVWAADGISL